MNLDKKYRWWPEWLVHFGLLHALVKFCIGLWIKPKLLLLVFWNLFYKDLWDVHCCFSCSSSVKTDELIFWYGETEICSVFDFYCFKKKKKFFYILSAWEREREQMNATIKHIFVYSLFFVLWAWKRRREQREATIKTFVSGGQVTLTNFCLIFYIYIYILFFCFLFLFNCTVLIVILLSWKRILPSK